VHFRDVGSFGGHLFLAVDYIHGSDLARLLSAHRRIPMKQAVGLACQVLEALEHAHERGFVHRDIKPANVLLEADGKRRRVKLADFGLARVYESSQLSGLTLPNDMGGTPGYMPPEQITNFREARPPADQYATAATLYHMLTGQHVYDLPKGITELLPLILTQPPVPILERGPGLPAALAEAIHRALEREPEKRFRNVRAFRKALVPFAR
jgi:serine/threonine-protein kinase